MPKRGTLLLILLTFAGLVSGAALAYWFAGLNTVPLMIGATAGGLIYGRLWLRQLRAPRGSSRPLTLALIAAPLVLIAAFAWATVDSMNAAGQLGVPTDSYQANFDRLWQTVDRVYPYFDVKAVDWPAVRSAYAERLDAVDSDAAYYALVEDALAELNDMHTYLASPSTFWRWRFGSLMDIGGQAVVTEVDAAAESAGLEVGDVVTAINGRPVDDVLAGLPASLRVGSTPWNARAISLFFGLAVWGEANSLDVTVTHADGSQNTLTLNIPAAPEDEGSGDDAVVTWRALESGIGVIRIRTFSVSSVTLAAKFDEALAALADASGLILDVRGNGGGSSLAASVVAGRFLDAPFQYATEDYRVRLPSRFWLEQGTRIAYPRTPFDARPLVVLTDALVVSSAEEFVLMLADSQRAVTVGRVTGGGSGNPIEFPLVGGGTARISIGDLRRMNGERLEGAGITPDVPIDWTMDDVRSGHDPDVAAAEFFLLQNRIENTQS